MKKITLLFILCIAVVNWSYSQCTTQGYQWPSSTVTVAASPGAQVIANNNWPDNEFSVLTGIVPGETYTVAAAMYITVTESDGTTVIGHGANSVTFTAGAGVTDIMCFWTLDALCNGFGGPDTVTTIECTTCTCTETVAPGAPTNPTPADLAIDIPIAGTVITPFSWDESALGGGNESFDISLGTDTAGTDIGTITNATNGNGINYGGWVNGTTYYWSVTANNCIGSTQSAVWSFTTANCTSIAAPDAVTLTTPTDGAIDVNVDPTDGDNAVTFDWTAATTGDPATSFDVYLGDSALTLGLLGNTADETVNITGMTLSTQYFWRIDAVNCFGTGTPGTVWSFTTEATFSVDDNDELNLFTVYPNPVKDIVRIETGLSIDNINIINYLGQNVLTIDNNSIINNEVDLSSITNGLYFMKISSGDKSQTIKIIKE